MTKNGQKETKNVLLTVFFLAAVALTFYFVGCPLRFWAGLPCPGCGITRAFFCLAQGQWALAFHYHPLFWLVPAMAWAALSRAARARPRLQAAVLWLSSGLFLLTYLLRLLARHPVLAAGTPTIISWFNAYASFAANFSLARSS